MSTTDPDLHADLGTQTPCNVQSSLPVNLPELGGKFTIGSDDGRQFFTGDLDEVEVSKVVRSADWIKAATSPQINGQQLYFYGFQFWLGRSLVHGRAIEWVAGVGYGGQRLFIVPALDLVVLVHAGLYASSMQSWVPLIVLNRFVLQSADGP